MTNHRNTLPEDATCLGCLKDYKKMTLAASLSTMIFAVLCVGFLVNYLMDVSAEIDELEHYHTSDRQSRDIQNDTRPEGDNVDELYDATITKVLYTVLVCVLVLLLISSVGLLKGVFQRKQSLIITWIMIVVATIIFSTGIIVRDLHIHGPTGEIHGKLAFLCFFIIMEAAFMRFVVEAFKQVRRHSQLRHRRNAVVFDPSNPDRTIFTIAENMEPQNPETLFKLPSYDEVTDGNEGTSKDPRGSPPPYEPPPYVP